MSLLGVAQIISWGSLYYSLTVLALPIREELGFSDLMIFGATDGQIPPYHWKPKSATKLPAPSPM